MTRRNLFTGALGALPLMAESPEAERKRLYNDLFDKMTAFIAEWNLFSGALLKSKGEIWPLQEATDMEKAFRDITSHPLWMSKRKKASADLEDRALSKNPNLAADATEKLIDKHRHGKY